MEPSFAYRADRPLAAISAAERQSWLDVNLSLPDPGRSVAQLLSDQPTRAVLVVLQAVNAGGKDGTIEALKESGLSSIRVERLKRPINPLADHDLLRVARSILPRPGEFVVFNRSYYEDLVHAARSHGSDFPSLRDAILLFEDELVTSHITLVKLHLHIDQDEQRRRLDARRHAPLRHLHNPWDYRDQAMWPQLMEAFDAVLAATHTAASPWLVLPANNRDIRNDVVARVLRDVLGGSRG